MVGTASSWVLVTGAEALEVAPGLHRAERSAVDKAAAEARLSGRPVELTSEHTETDTVRVNPDGTLTRSMAAEPVRARTVEGWKDIDLDLVVRDGRLESKVSAAPVSFSSGGRGALVELVAGSNDALVVDWPDALPSPVVDGATARYIDVFAGVDLLMTATPSGYSHVLEVKTPEAARQRELKEIPMGVTSEGSGSLKVRQGGFTLSDKFGREVLSSPDSLMWDSSGTDESRATPALQTQAVEQQPAEAAKQAPVEVKATGPDEITLVPDQEMLRSPDTEFPVYIDPPVSMAFNQAGRAMTFRQHPSLTSWNWSSETSQGGQGVGYQNFDGVSTKRLFWQFNLGTKLAGATVSSATFMAKEVWAASCAKKEINLYRTHAISSKTNWNNQPSAISLQDSKTVSFGREDCPADQAGDRVLNFNVKTAMQTVADKGTTTVTFQLRADENDPVAWKRFAPRPNDDGEVLSVSYSFPPGPPANLKLQNPTKTCSTGAQRPVIGNDAPDLVATTSDRDAGQGQKVKMSFELRKGLGGAGGTLLGSFTTTLVDPRNGKTYMYPQADVAARLPYSGGKIVSGTYSWRPKAIDDTGLATLGPWCEFTVDSTHPGTPEVSWSSEATWIYQGAAVPVTFGPGSSNDVVKYAYSWNAPAMPTSSGQQLVIANDLKCSTTTKKCTLPLALPKAGFSVLRVWSVDAAGNPTTAPATIPLESAGLVATAAYTFNDVSEPAAAGNNSVVDGQDLYLWGPVPRFRGVFQPEPQDEQAQEPRLEYALEFAQGGVGWTDNPMVGTADSFTVAAEVDPVNPVGAPDAELVSSSTMISQVAGAGYSYRLGVDTGCVRPDATTHPCYVFAVRNTAGQTFTARSVLTATDEPGMVHLAGVYRAADNDIALFVDGELAAEVELSGTLVQPTSTSDDLTLVGTVETGAGIYQYFAGYLDEVEAWTGAAGEAQAFLIAGRLRDFRSYSRPEVATP